MPFQKLKSKSLVMKIARDFVVSGVERSPWFRLVCVAEGATDGAQCRNPLVSGRVNRIYRAV